MPSRGVLRKKSLEELEDILAQRWGTQLSTFTSDDWDDDDDDDNEEDEEEASGAMGSNTKSQPVFRGRPVVDPWNDDNKKLSKGGQRPSKEEFYDADDEGYESSQRSSDDLSYLIAPKPAGASGKTTPSPRKNNNSEGGYFLRPPPPPPSNENTPMSADPTTSEKESSLERAQDSPSQRRQRIVPIPMLDEDGNPVTLSIQQAERLFEEQTGRSTSTSLFVDDDDDDELEESYEEDFPLVALAAQSNPQWTDLGVTHPTLLENLDAMGCTTPLPVQQSATPVILARGVSGQEENGDNENDHQDVVIGTYTGSGKTLAFLVPIVQNLLENQVSPDALSVLVVAPGRELASQIVSVARQVCRGTPYTAQLAIGGTTFSRNLQTIRQRKPSILVGTPGRLAELIVGKPGEKGGRLKPNQLRNLVLDEFDALLEYKPHREPTAALVQKLQRNPNLQSVLCSATASDVLESPKFQQFVRPDYFLAMSDKDDVFVTAGGEDDRQTYPRVSRTVMHGVVHVPHRRFVIETIRRILHTEPMPQQILMFVDNSRKVDLMVEKLESMGILAAALHGGSRNDKMDRAEVSKALREGYVGIVVATELAARGLDAPLLTHVINVDLPTDASHYAHRAGRCGRGGRPGIVINITSDPKERRVPLKFTNQLGVDLYTVDVRNGKLNVVNPDSVDLDNL